MKQKHKFIEVFSNLPMDVRREIILVIDDQPITWNVAYDEIKHETKFGKRILDKLIDLELI